MLIRRACISVYIFVNLLFILKYGSRIGLIYTLAFIMVYLVGIWWAGRKFLKSSDNFSKPAVIAFGVAVLSLVAVQQAIDPYELRVDRWSAIHNFISYLFKGQYPYLAPTHLGGYGSPFPVWQLLHIPFYLLGNVGLSVFVCMGAYLYSLFKWKGYKVAAAAGMLLICSPAFVYEVVVRSDLMANFMLVCAFIHYYIYKGIRLESNLPWISLFCGLALSSRLSVGIPLFIFFLKPYLGLDVKRQIMFPVLVLLFFVMTFVPFLMWSSDLVLFEFNPFVLQTRQGNISDMLLLIPMLLAAAWYGGTVKRGYFAVTGFYMIALVVVTFVHNMTSNSNFDAVFSSAYDITYFNMSLPFIITALALYNDKRQMTA